MNFVSFTKRIKLCCCFIIFSINARSQVYDSIANNTSEKFPSFHVRSLYVPAALIALGAYSNKEEDIINNLAIKRERDEVMPGFRTHIDDYMQFAPIVAGYSVGVAYHPDKLWIYTKEVLINQAIVAVSVTTVKRVSKVPSIVNGSYNAFPSGHTTQAFSGATLFNDNFARGNLWLQTASYACASTVGILRILNERHWASDVVAGAGFGIISAKLSELAVKGISRKPHHVVIDP